MLGLSSILRPAKMSSSLGYDPRKMRSVCFGAQLNFFGRPGNKGSRRKTIGYPFFGIETRGEER